MNSHVLPQKTQNSATNMKRLCLLAVAALVALTAISAAEWQRLSARLMTSWGETIDPENVWQEYPRPQLVRGDWMNLNGIWDYYLRTNSVKLTYEEKASKFTKKILVPFGVESALSGVMHTDLGTVANSTLMYRRTFILPQNFQGKRILLHFGAVDWQCAVFVNGTKVGEHKGGSDPFTFDITNYLQTFGEQELQVAVYDPSNRGGQPRGKQAVSPSSIWYTSCSGIWQTVWLEAVGQAYVERYELVPDAATGSVRVRVVANDPSCKYSLIARDGEQVVATSEKLPVGEEVTLVIPDAKLWTPDTPFLYNLDIILCSENCQECDRARGYFGLRTLTKALVDGSPAFMLNGKPIFMFGPLDQGWWPDGLLTPPSYEAMVYDLKTIKSLGMNMVRKHIKVENDLWYEWCDRNGLIVWQDMPSGSEGGSLGTKEEIQHNFYTECEHIVTALKQHPCIGLWVPFNEGWGQDASSGAGHTMRGYLVVRNADADYGRLMNSVSGWTDFEIGDCVDTHSYPAPNANANSRKERVNVCGEYGGITLMVEGHLWDGSQQTYTQVESSDDYTERFNQYTAALQTLQQSRGLWGAVYTQITDVEQEVNGILTYDRKVLKVNKQQLASIRKKIEFTINNRMSTSKSVLTAGDNSDNVNWRYTTNQPEEGWEQPDFVDRKWDLGLAGFGEITQAAAKVRTTWNTPEIWLRRHFRLSGINEDNIKDLCLRMFYDEDTEVYINGVFAMSITGYNTSYQLFEISEAARASIDFKGDNVIAIHTLQTTGGQYIDAGFSLRSFKSIDDVAIKPLTGLEVPTTTEDPGKAYLLTYTTKDENALFYSYSYDGLTWHALNGGKSIFGNANGQPALLSPFVYRMEDSDGKTLFHLVHNAEEPGLYHWTSEDLINWQPVNGTDAVVIGDRVQSPGLIYEESSGYYYYYWTGAGSAGLVSRYARTQDFTNFTKPLNYFDTSVPIKGLNIVPCNGKFLAILSDAEGKGLYQAYSKSLTPSSGKFTAFTRILSNISPLTSPLIFSTFSGDGWLLVAQNEEDHALFCASMNDPQKLRWHLYERAFCRAPEDMREGKVVVITRDELSQLLMTLDGIDTGLSGGSRFGESAWNDDVYNLAGQRVARRSQLRENLLSPGVYIVGSRKLFLK